MTRWMRASCGSRGTSAQSDSQAWATDGWKKRGIEIAGDHRRQPLASGLRPCQPAGHFVAQFTVGLAHRLLEQFLLVAEIVQHDALGGTGMAGHLFQRRAGHAFGLQHFEGRPAQLRPPDFADPREFHANALVCRFSIDKILRRDQLLSHGSIIGPTDKRETAHDQAIVGRHGLWFWRRHAHLRPKPESCKTVRLAEPGWNDLAFTTGVGVTLLKALGYEPTARCWASTSSTRA